MNWIEGGFAQNYFGRHLPFARVVELARTVIEAGRILEGCATHRSIAVDMTGWEESLAAFAPGEVLDPMPTDLSPAKGFARVKELERAMTLAISVLAFVAASASWIPARRAAQIDPAMSLRE